MGLTSVMSGKEITAKTGFGDVSVRERLKLAGFQWDRSLRLWKLSESRFFGSVEKALYASLRPYEIPGIYVSDPSAVFLLSLWRRGFGGGVLIDNRPDLSEAFESALCQRCCDRVVVVSDRPEKWTGYDTVSFRSLSSRLDEIISPGIFAVFDGVPSRKTVAFEACAVLSLAACFRVVVLNPYGIRNIEDVQNAVLLAEPGVSPSYDFFRDHILVKNTGTPYSSKVYRNRDVFVSKVSSVVGRSCDIKLPSPVLVEPKPTESALFYLAKMKYTGVKSARLAELSLVDAVSAGIEMGEEIPEGYITAKQERAKAARKLGFFVYSRFESEKRPERNVLSMTVDPECDCFLCAAKLEEKKAMEMLSFLQFLSSFADIRN